MRKETIWHAKQTILKQISYKQFPIPQFIFFLYEQVIKACFRNISLLIGKPILLLYSLSIQNRLFFRNILCSDLSRKIINSPNIVSVIFISLNARDALCIYIYHIIPISVYMKMNSTALSKITPCIFFLFPLE